jgi:teichuronic acid exporter
LGRASCLIKISKLSPTSWVTTQTAVSQIFGALLFAIQAPLLGPKAFGLISIVMVFIGFCESVLGEVASEALVSVRQIDEEHFSTMTTANVAVAVVCGALVFAGAGAFSRLFGDPQLIPLARSMAILPVITAIGTAPNAATKRDMLFRPLAVRTIASVFAGGIVGLALTLAGAGVWALVWQAIITRSAASLVLWLAVPLKLRFGFSRRHLHDLWHFAFPTMLSKIMAWGSSQVPRAVLGLYWGPTELGLFSLGSRLSDLLLGVTAVPRYAVARVELRSFASNFDGLSDGVSGLLTRMSFFCFPLCLGGLAAAPTLFHAWLDQRWYGGIAPAQLMLLMSVASVTQYAATATLLALNFQRADAAVSLIQTILTVLLVLVAAPFGVTMAAAAMAARSWLLVPICAMLLRKKCGIPTWSILRAQQGTLLAALGMGISVWGLRLLLGSALNDVLTLSILVLAGGVVYAYLISVLQPDMATEFAKKFGFPSARRT